MEDGASGGAPEPLLDALGDDPVTLELWKQAGAKVDGVLVKFEPGMLREILKTAPQEFTQHARNPANSVRIGGKNVVFSPSYGSPFVMDLDKGRRYGTIEDFRNLVKLAYMAPALHHSGGTVCEPVDVAIPKRHLHITASSIRHSDKSFMGPVTHPERAADAVRMCELVFGPEFVHDNAVMVGLVNGNSPLVWDATMIGALRVYARSGQALVVAPFTLAGANTPASATATVARATPMRTCSLGSPAPTTPASRSTAHPDRTRRASASMAHQLFALNHGHIGSAR